MAPAESIPSTALQEFYNNEQFSDVHIFCVDSTESITIRAHKNILAMASGFFRRVFTKDADCHCVALEVGRISAFVTMMRYIYGFAPSDRVPAVRDEDGDWEDDDDNDESHLEFHLFVMASKYELPGLKEYALGQVKHALDESTATFLDESDVGFVVYSDFVNLVNFIYRGLPRFGGELLRLVEACCEEKIEKLMEEVDFQVLLRETPELSISMVQAMIAKKKAMTTST